MRIIRLLLISLFMVWTNTVFAGYECNFGADCARKGNIESDQKIRFRYHLKACNVYNEPRACFSVAKYYNNRGEDEENTKQFAYYAIKSCNLNYGFACSTLAFLVKILLEHRTIITLLRYGMKRRVNCQRNMVV